MHIAMITAGGAGMFCGSCMHDNTWARALHRKGMDVSLIPTYTPLRVDEPDQSLSRVFLGGINVYLNGRFPWWSRIPRPLTGWLDHPGLIRWATGWSVSHDASELGDLTLSMLNGEHGPHRAAVQELARFIATQLRPDVIIFSNALLCGALREIQQAWPVPVLCTLQGDDVFLDRLPESYRQSAIDQISKQAAGFHRFLVHSEFYRDYISRYLSLPAERFSLLPLGIDTSEHPGLPSATKNSRFTVGYFARICPEKGFHHLADALVLFRQRMPEVRLRFGGYQEAVFRSYLNESLGKLTAAGVDVENLGSPETVAEKAAFLRGLDVFSVPTDFLEPKGMPVLEALANGVPVVQPGHGVFPEMIGATGGGILVTPRDPQALADGLDQLSDPAVRLQRAEAGWRGVREHYSLDRLVDRTLEILKDITRLPSPHSAVPSR